MAGVLRFPNQLVLVWLLAVVFAVPPVQAETQASSPPQQASTHAANNADHAGQVWVNTKTKVYHLPTSKWAGNTRQGKWMTEAEAQRAGYRKASNE